MRRWLLRLGVLGAGAAISAASAPTLSAWVHTTSNPSGTLSAIPDWVAPTASRLVVQKGPPAGLTERGVSGYVRPGGTYRVCSKFTDTGNPASGLKDVSLTNVASFTSSVVNNVLDALVNGSSWCPSTDDRESASQTVAAGTPDGTKTFTVQVRDNALNTRTETGTVMVDGTPPTPTAFSAVNGSGTTGVADTGDVVTLTFSEPIDPNAVIPGWDGTGTQTVRANFLNDNKGDRIQFLRSSATGWVVTPLTATTGSTPWIDLKQNYVNGGVYFTSTIAVSGNSFVITFGAPSVTGVFRAPNLTASAPVWSTSGSLFDRAGNVVTAGSPTMANAAKF